MNVAIGAGMIQMIVDYSARIGGVFIVSQRC